MEKEDARKQSRKVLHERRKQVIRMHRKGMRRYFGDLKVVYAAS